ncbi:MAG: glycosyltransferase [Bacteroidales bacterium]|nr:glycosyltransferase [Bacteroidales bacterium]
MAKLSVVIVNYNVAYFLEQCLHSVYEAAKGIPVEIFVVDNHSVDKSLEMLRNNFPEVKVIANEENVGFAKANNQAIRIATGEYILLLNPDTIVQADTFVKTLDFMDKTPDAGALGVKMIDGQGHYLPESKRGLPLPSVAFYKIFGLSKIFRKSKRFGRYHLTYLDPDEINEVDVLPGAFMLMRKSVLDQIGLLDESFFMYGEDIDLSYRVTLGGYKNYYFPLTRIIHYKGESTKKSSVNYVLVFYQAMRIFAKKHFSKNNARLFDGMINLAIWFRAFLAIVKRLFLKIWMPLLDFLLIGGGLLGIAAYWEKTVLLPRGVKFPDEYLYLVLPLYALVWVGCIRIQNAYRVPVSFKRLNRGVLLGGVVLLLVYALLGEQFRFSRAVLLIGILYVFLILNLVRWIIGRMRLKSYPVGDMSVKRLLIVGGEEEAERVSRLLPMMSIRQVLAGCVHPDKDFRPEKESPFVGNLSQIMEIIEIYGVNEIVFCGKDISSTDIMTVMSRLQDFPLEYKIAPSESLYIIGSRSIHVEGDVYTLSANSIGKRENRRRKRLFDVCFSTVLLLISPLLIWFVPRKTGFYRNLFQVLSGRRSWVGYAPQPDSGSGVLPPLREGVYHTVSAVRQRLTPEMAMRANSLYAKDYSTYTDFRIVLRMLFRKS